MNKITGGATGATGLSPTMSRSSARGDNVKQVDPMPKLKGETKIEPKRLDPSEVYMKGDGKSPKEFYQASQQQDVSANSATHAGGLETIADSGESGGMRRVESQSSKDGDTYTPTAPRHTLEAAEGGSRAGTYRIYNQLGKDVQKVEIINF